LRLRAGDVQVGDGTGLEELFAEPRFNSWSVGEVHVLDRRIVPNGRRDSFEQNAHLGNLMNQLTPIAREISRRCRSNSIRRNWLRRFELAGGAVRETIETLRQGSLGAADRSSLSKSAESTIAEMDRIAAMPVLSEDVDALRDTAAHIRIALQAVTGPQDSDGSPLSALPPADRATYERMFELIYECSVNRVAARKLIERITFKVASLP
jgi:molecular chaperone HtpG